jgi:hypothetical protein
MIKILKLTCFATGERCRRVMLELATWQVTQLSFTQRKYYSRTARLSSLLWESFTNTSNRTEHSNKAMEYIAYRYTLAVELQEFAQFFILHYRFI